MADGGLERIALDVQRQLAANAPQSVIDSLKQPTRQNLFAAGSALLAAGELDVAESLYRMLSELAGTDHWPLLGLARVASGRGASPAIVSAWTTLLERFPERAEPSWYIEMSIAEYRAGNYRAAEEHSRRGAERFAQSAALVAARAEALLALGSNAEAIAAFRAAVDAAPDQAKPRWFMGLAAALRGAGLADDEDSVVTELSTRFPDDAAVLAFRAQHAVRRADLPVALSLWMECLRRPAQQSVAQWLNACAGTLFRLWRPQEALEMWSELRRRFPDFAQGYVNAAEACEELGHWDTAQRIWSELIERNPASAKPDWHARRVRSVLNQPFCESLELAIKDLESRFPDSSLAQRMKFEALTVMHVGFDAVSAVVEEALKRNPGDRDVMLLHVQHLLAGGRASEAEDVVRKLEATADDTVAKTARWSVLLGRGDVVAMRAWAQQVVTDGTWVMIPGIVIQELLMDIRLPGSDDQALALCEEMDRRFPGRAIFTALKARVLVELSRDDEALKLIDGVPSLYRRREILELRAWAAAYRGDLERAREIWEGILANCYFAALHSPEPVLKADTPRRRVKKHDGVMAIVPVRDEIANLPGFLEHHRRLGVRRFVVIDNGSTDGSDSYAKSQPDVLLYRTEDSFPASGSGMRWINALIDRHADGGWCLFADADEDFVYPGWETTPLDRLVEYLDAQNAEAVRGFMLDLYPERLVDFSGRLATRADCRYFDSNYLWRGLGRSPFRQPLGGIRARLFGIFEMAHKTPFLKGGRGLYLNNHETTPLRLADTTCILLHYKMADLFKKAEQYATRKPGVKVADRIPNNIRRYTRYGKRLKAIANMDLRVEGLTQALGDSLALADAGLMEAPPHFRAWLNGAADSRPASG